MLKQIKIFTHLDYEMLKKDTERWDGYYNKEILESFESFVNFELSVLFDNGCIIEEIRPTFNTNHNGMRGLQVLIVYKIKIEN